MEAENTLRGSKSLPRDLDQIITFQELPFYFFKTI
jgi:hypothetical protein